MISCTASQTTSQANTLVEDILILVLIVIVLAILIIWPIFITKKQHQVENKILEEKDMPCITCKHNSNLHHSWDSEECDGCCKANSHYEPNQ